MITLQHSLLTLIHYDGNINDFKTEIPYVLLPDSVRSYGIPRQCSHFEQSKDGKDCSWMIFPEEIKNINLEIAQKTVCNLVKNIQPCCMGETTNIKLFEKHNSHLCKESFIGIKHHLVQDIEFDKFIRKQIDCSDMYKDIFIYQNRQINGKAVRKIIAEIESDGLYLLAKQVYEKYKITADQKWFDENVKLVLDNAYPQDLSDKTYQYMRIDPVTNEMIKQHEFGKKAKLSESKYNELYKKVLSKMSNYEK